MSGGVSRSSSFKGLTHSSSAPTFSGGAKSKLKSGKKLNKDEVGFLEAAQKGDIDAIIECTSKTNFFKKSIVDVNCSDSLGRNALMLAAISGKFTAVEYLLNRLKVDAEAQDVHGLNVLMHAIDHCRVHIAFLLISSGTCTVDLKDSIDSTPLMHACKAQNLRLIQFLIQRMLKLNIPIDESNNNGDTALTIGIKTGNISVVKILLENHQISKLQPDKLLKVAHPSHKAIQEYLQHFFSRQSPKKQSSLPKNGDLLMSISFSDFQINANNCYEKLKRLIGRKYEGSLILKDFLRYFALSYLQESASIQNMETLPTFASSIDSFEGSLLRILAHLLNYNDCTDSTINRDLQISPALFLKLGLHCEIAVFNSIQGQNILNNLPLYNDIRTSKMYDPELEYLCKRMIEGGVNNNKKGKLPSSIFLNMFRISSISFIYEKTLSFFVDVCSSVECPSPEKIPVQVLSLLLEDIGIKFNAEFSHIIEQLIQENERSFQNSFQTRDEIDASFRMRTKAFDTVGIDSEDSLVARLERRKRKSEAQLLSSKAITKFCGFSQSARDGRQCGLQ